MSISWAATVRIVEDRAQGYCEYCHMLKALQIGPFHVEHVIPKSKDGTDELENLAWSCAACNFSKSNRTNLVDPETGHDVLIYNPRQDRWQDHFAWEGYRLIGRTPEGRALVAALDLNHLDRLFIRQAENLLGFSPK